MASVAELQQLVAQLQTQLDIADEQGVRKASADFTRELKRAEEVLKTLPNDQKKSFGKALNEVRKQATSAVEARLAAIAEAVARKDLERSVDVTLPGRARTLGHLNPITIARREIEEIFAQIGFTVAVGPQIETDFHNFEALAMPKDHPARDMQDTFYIDGVEDVVLRTHTSPVQIRTMLRHKPPVRIIAPGTVYRRDDDATHSPMFNQVEGLCVDEGVTFADLKGVLMHFARSYFGEDIQARLRPSFFP
jgi:phenylalanyl-tRNA synthetase alpha chain